MDEKEQEQRGVLAQIEAGRSISKQDKHPVFVSENLTFPREKAPWSGLLLASRAYLCKLENILRHHMIWFLTNDWILALLA